MSIVLFKEFAAKMKDYIDRHNDNYTLIEQTLNDLLDVVVGQSGSLSVTRGLEEIFDRRGIIGIGSYDFSNGTLTGPNYNLSVAAGAYWNPAGPTFYAKGAATSLSMLSRDTGSYYVGLDSASNPIIQTVPDATTMRQFDWNATTHQVSNKALYTSVAVLFDGDDYADCLTSAARAKNFTKLADRLEEIESAIGTVIQTPASADTININCALGGNIRMTLDRAATTINFSGAYDGQHIVVEVIQDATGNRGVAFGTMVQAGDDFTLPAAISTTANKRSFLGFLYSGDTSKYNYVSLARGY